MSGGLGSLIAGLGLGAAQAYNKKASEDAENAFQDERDTALASGGKIPMPSRSTRKKPPSAIEALTGKVKSMFSDKPAGATPAATAAPAATVEPVAEVAPLPTVASTAPEVDTDAFNDDATVPNEPKAFKSSYA